MPAQASLCYTRVLKQPTNKVVLQPVQLSPTLPPGNVGFHQSQHVDGGLIELDEHSIVDLPQSEELQDLPHTWTHTIDTTTGSIHQVMYRNYRCTCILLSSSECVCVCVCKRTDTLPQGHLFAGTKFSKISDLPFFFAKNCTHEYQYFQIWDVNFEKSLKLVPAKRTTSKICYNICTCK